jgi:uncharacterized glyoxalase superfamily protein PhnB
MLLVEDVDAGLAWYRDVLGASLRYTLPDTPPFEWVSLTLDDVEIMLSLKREAQKWYSDRVRVSEAPANFIAYIYVEDANSLCARIRGKAEIILEPTDQPYGIREFAIRDPFGFVLVFAEVIA